MDVGFAGPRLVVYCLHNGSSLGYVIQAADAGLVVADVLSSNQTGAARDRIIDRACRQMVVRLAEPIDATVGHTGDVDVGMAKGVDVIRSAFRLEPLRPQERRVAYDDIGLGPLSGLAVGGDEGVGGNEVLVKVVQRQGQLGDVALVGRDRKSGA